MAGIYDVHTHLNDELYEESNLQPSEIIKQAKKTGIDIINVVGIDIKTSKIAIRQATQFSNVYAVVGIHPNETNNFDLENLEELTTLANSKVVVAIGEIGLDYSKNDNNKDEQKNLFEKQLKIAEKLNLPVVIHLRDKLNNTEAYKDAIKILITTKIQKIMIHGFEGNEEFAQLFTKLGYLLSFNGKITYSSKKLEKIVKIVSLNNIVIESDAPYFAPVPYQKELNYPTNTILVAEKIAQIKKIDIDEIISATRVNGQKFFHIDD